MTRQELEKTHKHYDAFKDGWLFYRRSYLGGQFYRDGNYLLQHSFESNATYKRRKEISYYYNYCTPIIDIFISYLYRRGPERSYGALSPEPVPPRRPRTLFDSFWWNCDFEGSTLDQFIREAQKAASIYGRVSIIVDTPRVQASTQAEAIEQDLRPYLVLITPEMLLDWRYAREANGKPVLVFVKILETEDTDENGIAYKDYRIWTCNKWELWRLRKNSSAPELIGSGDVPLGEIPLVNLYNKRMGMRMNGISDIQDIAHINKNIYYLCSDAKEIIENTAFPMLALPYQRGGSETREVGPKNILEFDPEQPNGKPFWFEPPHSSLTEIREWVQMDAQEIARIAMMGGLRNVETSTQPWSGASITAQNQQLHSVLVEKATNAEQAELDIFRLWAKWQGTTFDGNVVYPREFDVKDLALSLQNLINARGAGVASAAFERERQKAVAAVVLPGLDEAIRDSIKAEIDNSKTRGEGENVGDGVDAGSSASDMVGSEADNDAPV